MYQDSKLNIGLFLFLLNNPTENAARVLVQGTLNLGSPKIPGLVTCPQRKPNGKSNNKIGKEFNIQDSHTGKTRGLVSSAPSSRGADVSFKFKQGRTGTGAKGLSNKVISPTWRGAVPSWGDLPARLPVPGRFRAMTETSRGSDTGHCKSWQLTMC